MTRNSGHRVLVTGGSGFIGTNLIDALVRDGATVLNASVRPPRDPEHHRFHIRTDILAESTVAKIVREFEPQTIVHLAARTGYGHRDDTLGYRINTEGTRNIITAANSISSVRRMIFASSFVVDRPDLSGSYVESKRNAETIIRTTVAERIEWCIVRPVHIWGEWFGTPFRGFFEAVQSGWYMHPGTIDIPRYLGYVGNTVFQIQRIMESGREQFHRNTLYLGDYQPVTIREWANLISARAGKRLPRTIPEEFVTIIARIGDLLSAAGWENAPFTTHRFRNMRVPMPVIPMDKTELLAGALPFSITDGIDATLRWLALHRST